MNARTPYPLVQVESVESASWLWLGAPGQKDRDTLQSASQVTTQERTMRPGVLVAVLALVGVILPNVTGYISTTSASSRWVAPHQSSSTALSAAGIRRPSSCPRRPLQRCRAQSSAAVDGGGNSGGRGGAERPAKPPLKVTGGGGWGWECTGSSV